MPRSPKLSVRSFRGTIKRRSRQLQPETSPRWSFARCALVPILAIWRLLLVVLNAFTKVLDSVISPLWRAITWGIGAALALVIVGSVVQIYVMAHSAVSELDSLGLMHYHPTTKAVVQEPLLPSVNIMRNVRGLKQFVGMNGAPVQMTAPVAVLTYNSMAPNHPTPQQFGELVDEIVLNHESGVHWSRIVVVITSPGGSVTEYGALFAEMLRLRATGVPVTVCVDQVAASGGYMMAMTGNEICASPFAIVGSVGVVKEFLNYNKLLNVAGVTDVTITAGKHKRGVTPTSKITPEMLAHEQGKVDSIHRQFKTELVNLRKLSGQTVDPEKALNADTWTAQESMTSSSAWSTALRRRAAFCSG